MPPATPRSVPKFISEEDLDLGRNETTVGASSRELYRLYVVRSTDIRVTRISVAVLQMFSRSSPEGLENFSLAFEMSRLSLPGRVM
jgi:hypothetical protein